VRRASKLWVAVLVAAVPSLAFAAKDTGLADALRRELALTRQAADMERALDALERAQASTEYTTAVIEHGADDGLRRLDAYRHSRGDRGKQVRARARAMYKLARGGVMRMALEPVDGDGVHAADRVVRGRDLRWLVRHDLQELSVYTRAEARAESELVEAMQGFAAVSAVRMVSSIQASALDAAQAAVEPELSKARRERHRRVHGHPDAAERELLALVRDNWNELDELRGLGDGRLVRPVRGRIVGRFGAYTDPVLRLPMERNGLELAAHPNDPVRVLAKGRVAMISRLPGYEQVVVVDHGGGELSMTGRLWNLQVDEDDELEAGDVLGMVAPKMVDDGLGPTVYVELRHGDKPVDPTPRLSG
jgi:septal ring factor EnvC (AmiA/AmiB activator)